MFRYSQRFFAPYYLCVVLVLVVPRCVMAAHPAMDGMTEMEHPSQPLPEGALVPSVSFEIHKDPMDGFNLILSFTNLDMGVPGYSLSDHLVTEEGMVMRGHMHLYINSAKMMRIYGSEIHVPADWLIGGVNSVTVTINNHQHGAFTAEGNEIQSTLIVDTEAEQLVRSRYSWPQPSP